jgi:UDP-4-amino-4,6-dideoxy-N-acetyl-beta-L-altrosamine transaminase
MNQRLKSYGRHEIDDDDIGAVVEVLRGDWLTTGPAVAEFEEAFAERVGARYAIACSNGTAALHLASLALGLGPEDEVIVPSMTFAATANAALYVDAKVILADVDPATGLLTEKTLKEAINRCTPGRFKAVFPVHLNGQAVDIEAISEIAKSHGARVVEDACHALGSIYESHIGQIEIGACAHSDIAVFSFHPVKTITTGEGGMLTTNDDTIAEKLYSLRSHGIVRQAEKFQNIGLALDSTGAVNPWYQEMQSLGYNYRISDILCALGRSQLRKLDSFIEQRRQLAKTYDQLLEDSFPWVRPVSDQSNQIPALHLYAVQIDFETAGLERGALMRILSQKGISSQVHYVPVHFQPYYRAKYGTVSLPGAEAYYKGALSLPLHPGMDDSDVEFVVSNLKNALAGV